MPVNIYLFFCQNVLNNKSVKYFCLYRIYLHMGCVMGACSAHRNIGAGLSKRLPYWRFLSERGSIWKEKRDSVRQKLGAHASHDEQCCKTETSVTLWQTRTACTHSRRQSACASRLRSRWRIWNAISSQVPFRSHQIPERTKNFYAPSYKEGHLHSGQ